LLLIFFSFFEEAEISTFHKNSSHHRVFSGLKLLKAILSCRAEDLWNATLPELAELEESSDESRLSRSSRTRSRLGGAPSPGQPRVPVLTMTATPTQCPCLDYANLSDVAPSEEFDDELLVADVDDYQQLSHLEPLELSVAAHATPLHFRHGARNPGDLMWEWASPPRPARPARPPPPEPYSHELFRLVRM